MASGIAFAFRRRWGATHPVKNGHEGSERPGSDPPRSARKFAIPRSDGPVDLWSYSSFAAKHYSAAIRVKQTPEAAVDPMPLTQIELKRPRLMRATYIAFHARVLRLVAEARDGVVRRSGFMVDLLG